MKVRFSVGLLALLSLFLAFQALLLQQAWAENPFARVPHGDAEVYWAWAERIAQGEWVATEPFQSAPLYPYFLGLLRALGLDLLGVYAVQAALGAATLALIALATRRRAGVGAGLLAGAMWLLLDEAAFLPGRIWNLPLQLFTASLLLWYATRIPYRYGMRCMLGLGVVSGLAVLANPALLPAVILIAAWAAFAAEERNLVGGFAVLAVVALMLAPATWHNRQASGETILVSAHAGLTFAHGNGPGATGIYHPVPGVSEQRRQQNLDALRVAEQATGESGWAAANSYFFQRGWSWIVGHPGEAAVLELRKAWWLLSGRYYADLYNPQLEQRVEFGSRQALAFLDLALLIPLALFGLVLAWRQEGFRRRAPEFLLLLGPALIVLIFWYSPRYRLPMAPAVLLLSSQALVAGWRGWQELPRRTGPASWCAGMLVLALVAGQVNRVARFDHPAMFMPSFLHTVGDLLRLQGDRDEEALPYLERAVERGFDTFGSRYSLALCQMRVAEQRASTGEPAAVEQAIPLYEQAADNLREAVAHQPQQFEARFNLASLQFWLWELGRRPLSEVKPSVEAALALAREQGHEGRAAQLQQWAERL